MHDKETLVDRFFTLSSDYPCNPTKVEGSKIKFHLGYNANGFVEKRETFEFVEATQSWKSISLTENIFNQKDKLESIKSKIGVSTVDGSLKKLISNESYSYNSNENLLEISYNVSGDFVANLDGQECLKRKTMFNADGLPIESQFGLFDEQENVIELHEQLLYTYDEKGNLVEEITNDYCVANEERETRKTWSYDAQNREKLNSTLFYDNQEKSSVEIQIYTSYDNVGNINHLKGSVKYVNASKLDLAEEIDIVRNSNGQLLECTLRVQANNTTPNTNSATSHTRDRRFVFVYDENHAHPIKQIHYIGCQKSKEWELTKEFTISYNMEI